MEAEPRLSALLAGLFVVSAATRAAEAQQATSFDDSTVAHAYEDEHRPLITAGDDYPDVHGWLAPDFFKLQTGGFLGAINVGVGYSIFDDVVEIAGAYGYAPPAEEGDHYHALTATLAIRPLRINPSRALIILPIYVGGGGLVAFGPNVFHQQPDAYPPGYYPPNALQAIAFLGFEADLRRPEHEFFKRHGLFVEFVTINQYLDSLLNNRSLRLLDAFSTAVGYRAAL